MGIQVGTPGPGTTMGTLSVGVVLFLILSCQGLKIRSNCRTGASCVHSQNGYDGDLDIVSKCRGAYCGVIYGQERSRQRNNQRNRGANRGSYNQQNYNQDGQRYNQQNYNQ